MAHHNDTFKVSTQTAFLVLRNPELAIPYRAALMLQRYAFAGDISEGVLQNDYPEVLGLSLATAHADINAMLKTYDIEDGSITFAHRIVHKTRGKVLVRHSFKKMLTELRLMDLGTAIIRREALCSIEEFRVALSEVVYRYGGETQGNVDGWWTVSREGIRKLTGMSISTQKRREIALKIEVRENHAILAEPSAQEYAKYGVRVKQRSFTPDNRDIQIRNSYRTHGKYVVSIRLSDEVLKRKEFPVNEEKRFPAEAVERIIPGVTEVAKQTYEGYTKPAEGQLATTTVDVSVEPLSEEQIEDFGGYAKYRNKPTCRGTFIRYHRGQRMKIDTYYTILDHIESPTHHADAFGDGPPPPATPTKLPRGFVHPTSETIRRILNS